MAPHQKKISLNQVIRTSCDYKVECLFFFPVNLPPTFSLTPCCAHGLVVAPEGGDLSLEPLELVTRPAEFADSTFINNLYPGLRLIKPAREGEDFLTGQLIFFTETAVTPERKVEKWFPRWEINRHAEG